MRLHYARAGSGPLLLFVHGFPQHWYAFRHQLAEFARDHTVVAVDLRGVNLSSKPARLWENGVWIGAEDMRLLLSHLGFSRCTLVGHDWGAAIGYSFALHFPDALERLVIISGSHPATFDRELHYNEEQIAGGGHWLFLRRADSATHLKADDYGRLRGLFAEHGFFTEEDRRAYLEAWRQPGAVEGLVAWYRKEGWGPAHNGVPAHGNYVQEVSSLVVNTPTLVIYGDADRYLHPGNYEGLDEYLRDYVIHRIPGGSHWLLDEAPDLVNTYLRRFLAEGPVAEMGKRVDARR